MSDWRQQYEDAAEDQAKHYSRFSDQQLIDAVRQGKTGDYYVIWYELAKRKPTATICRELYAVLLSDRPYLDRYHCAAALLTLLSCKDFEAVALSANWPELRDNLAKLGTLIESRF